MAHLCQTIGAFSDRCNSGRTLAESHTGAPRPKRSHGRRTLVGSIPISFSAKPLPSSRAIIATDVRRFGHLYRVPVMVTLGRFPKARESDSTWRTKEVRHVAADTVAP